MAQNRVGDAMTLQIKLLGPPAIRSNGIAVQPRGRKAWGLLAYLLLGPDRPSRTHLAELLFGEADDPIRALRWNLTELRRVLEGSEISSGEHVTLSLPPGSSVDANVVKRFGGVPASEVEDLERELLEGHAFSHCPAFEAWLLNERRHVRSCATDVLREASLSYLGAGTLDAAIGAGVRLVALDPLNEDDQALLIRCYAAAGDTDAAARQFAACSQLMREELGIEPDPSVAAAIQSPPIATLRAPMGGMHAVRAQLQAGAAAVNAGALEAGVDCLRRAATGAHSIADSQLMVDASLALGSTLAHAGRDHHQEAAAVLHGALEVAGDVSTPSAAAKAQLELAWIDFMAARYQRALRWIAAALSSDEDEPSVRCMALWIRGKISMETGSFAASLEDLGTATDLAEELNDVARMSFCFASLGRTQLLMRSLPDARRSLQHSLEVATAGGFVWTAPLAQSFLAEVEIADGNLHLAESLLDQALAGARQVGDASFESFALHARGVFEKERGDSEASLAAFDAAHERLLLSPDCEWAFAYALDGLADITSSIEHPSALRRTEELEVLAGRSGMKEMLVHAYLFRARLGQPDAVGIARKLTAEVDNPALHTLVEEGASRHEGLSIS